MTWFEFPSTAPIGRDEESTVLALGWTGSLSLVFYFFRSLDQHARP
jgi:hypothetical protein